MGNTFLPFISDLQSHCSSTAPCVTQADVQLLLVACLIFKQLQHAWQFYLLPTSCDTDTVLSHRSAGFTPVTDLPQAVKVQPRRCRRQRRAGGRGWARQHLRRQGDRASSPLCNVRSLGSKIEELCISAPACFSGSRIKCRVARRVMAPHGWSRLHG